MSDADRLRAKIRKIELQHPDRETDPEGYRLGQEKIARMIDAERGFKAAGERKVV